MKNNQKLTYPLHENAFSSKDVKEGMRVLLSKNITMGKETNKFEKYFAKKLGVKYAVMVNSGSSANLLATFASKNPLRKKNLNMEMNQLYRFYVGQLLCGL